MKRGYIIALILVLLVLIGINAFTRASRGQGTIKNPKDLQVAIDTTSVKKVEVSAGQERVVLEMQNNKWMITSPIQFEADQNTVRRIIGAFQEAFIDVEISNNAENHGKYDIEDGIARYIKIEHDNGTLELLVGKSGPGGVTFVRIPNDNRVFSMSSYLSGALRQSVTEYRNKALWDINPDNIRATEVSTPDAQMFTAIENDSTYRTSTNPDGPWVEPVLGKLTSYIRSLTALRASSFIDDVDSIAKLDFSEVHYSVKVIDATGKTDELIGILAGETSVIVRNANGQGPVWLVSKGLMQNTAREMEYMTTQEARQQPQMGGNQQLTPEMQRQIQEAMMKQGIGG